ncbi:7tm 6 domain containing protein [Asbolus verrucosus]|uniref:Odorant receptor n=1 Tax=Asbolus verrucosus TaxID=1661398 RepID=A0A482V9A7_ASBVE|nr:7tm 6 domain containing protein [Asbolus verrucosus]
MGKKLGDVFPLKDPAKRVLFIPKLMLEAVNFWPEKRNRCTKITNWIFIMTCVIVECGQIAFVIENMSDFTKIASALTTISTTFQSIVKLTVLYFNSDTLSSILSQIWRKFWPANIAGAKTENQIRTFNMIFICTDVAMFVSGFLFAFGFLSLPLRVGSRVLPFESVYPFDWSKSPFYEVIYVVQWMTNIALILVGICGHDYLFMGICNNVISQYILLKEVIKNLGKLEAETINRKFLGLSASSSKNKIADEDTKLLQSCIDQHAMLTHVCKQVENIFNISSGIQLVASVTALCMAAFIVTLGETDFTILTTVGVYLLGHLLQLFLFCILGNEVTYHANDFPVSVFSSEWYNVEKLNIKKDIQFVIARAQRQVKFSALGIMPLDMQTFISVLRLSFSFYTMLSTMA